MEIRRRTSTLIAQPASRRRVLVGGVAAMAGALASGAFTPATAASMLGSVGRRADCGACPTRIAIPDRQRPVSLQQAAEGNRQAIALAQKSELVMRANDAALFLASTIADDAMRRATIDILRNPAPLYQTKSPTQADKEAVRQELLAAGLIPQATTVEGIFPPVSDPSQAPQQFYSAPGSSYSAHHSFPGGLAVHEWVNGTLARHFLDTYDMVYALSSRPGAIDPSIVVAAPLWHDIHKVVVFQWNPDGSEFQEQIIGDTGAHHPLSGAEAIVRGMPADFVVAQLSAHDAPTTVKSNPNQTGLQRLVIYIRAAAIIARTDPVATGMLEETPEGDFVLAQDPARVEGTINHLSDHDFLFSNDSAAVMIRTLRRLAADYGINPDSQASRFNLFRNLVFSQLSDMRLYGVLQQGGASAVKVLIEQEVDLRQLQS